MKRKATPRTRAGMPLETLEQVVATLNPETEPGELAAQMVCVLAAPGRLEGARLWRVVNGAPTVWQESGELPAPDPVHIERILHGKNPHANGREIHMGAGARERIRWECWKRVRRANWIRRREDGWNFSGDTRKWLWKAASGAMR